MKRSNFLEKHRGAGVAQNAGPSRSHDDRIEKARMDKSGFKSGKSMGEIGKSWDETFRHKDKEK